MIKTDNEDFITFYELVIYFHLINVNFLVYTSPEHILK